MMISMVMIDDGYEDYDEDDYDDDDDSDMMIRWL